MNSAVAVLLDAATATTTSTPTITATATTAAAMNEESDFGRNSLAVNAGNVEAFMMQLLAVNMTTGSNVSLGDNITAGAATTDTPSSGFINLLSVQCVFGLVYGIIFSIGITGNMLVCFVVCRNKAMHTVTNFFITNLAVSDIMLCLLAVPFTPLYTFMERWVFGTTMCHLVSGAQAVSVYISSLTLTAIAMDRYIVIVYPFRNRMRVSTCGWLITMCWFIALVLTIPYGLYVRLYVDPATGTNYCEENWTSERSRKIFGTITFCLQFIVPFLLICFCYIRVSVRLANRARAKPGSKSAKKEEADRDRKKRTNRMLMAMVGVFGVSWLPLSVVNIVNDYMETNNASLVPFFMAHCLAMSSTCYNPFLYAWLNENFRKEFKQVLPCIRQRSGYNDMVCRTDRLNSQADGLSVTRASEIIPRGPTCGNSIKKMVRAIEGNEVVTIIDEAPEEAVQQRLVKCPTPPSQQTNGVMATTTNGTVAMSSTTSMMLANDLLEMRTCDGTVVNGK